MRRTVLLIIDIIIFCCWLLVTVVLTVDKQEDSGLILALIGAYIAINLLRMSKKKRNGR